MSLSEFQKRLLLSSVPLVRLNEQMLPAGIASGCLIDYSGKRLLLTVSHATGDQENWAIQLKYVPGKGTCNYQLGAMNFLAKATFPNPTLEDVDYSYVEVSSGFTAYRQEIEAPGYSVKSETPIDVHAPSLLDEPENCEEFGFCGMVMPTVENHFGEVYFGGELRVYDGLKFLRTEDDYHFFELPFAHPGHEHFKGCSGAPILGSSGSLVALVCGGCEESSEVWGISVRAYKAPIDILVGNVS